MCTDITFLIRAMPPFGEDCSCEHYHDSPPMDCISILLSQLDVIVLTEGASAVQVWECTVSDPEWHAWTKEPIPVAGLHEKVLARSQNWLSRLNAVTDDEVHQVTHETYGTSLAGVGDG